MDLFAKAKAAAPVSTAKKPAKKDDKKVFEVPAVVDYAGLCGAEKAVKALKTSLEGPLKAQMLDQFVELGLAEQSRPDNFKIVGGKLPDSNAPLAESSVELRMKGSNIALTDEECEILDANNIPYETEDKVTETFVINAAYVNDAEIMKRVSKALEGVKGLPEDFIVFQSEKKRIVTEKTIDACFKAKKSGIVKALLSICTTVALKAKINGTEESALKVVEKLVIQRREAKQAEPC